MGLLFCTPTALPPTCLHCLTLHPAIAQLELGQLNQLVKWKIVAFGWVGFRVDQLLKPLPQGPQHWCGTRQTQIVAGDARKRWGWHSPWACSSQLPAYQVQCPTELNSKSKEEMDRSVAPVHCLGVTRATNALFYGLHSEPGQRASTRPCLLRMFCLHIPSKCKLHSSVVLCCSFTSFIIPTTFPKHL